MQNLTPYNHPDYHNLPSPFPPHYASAWGEDLQGIWIDVLFKGVTQRFRWIPRGQFTMGSPKSEKERESIGKETLHEVTLTQGFWLADTACTQELWLAVMGKNPSNFKDDLQTPVENVSWLDAYNFLIKLNQSIPNLNVHLPTEAQWEYACRAGTITPFSFGENISPDLVNYDGNYPYANGQKGEYREKTVPVKALPANQWGLYQMHGNVWEWCLDEYQDDLGAEAVIDPVNARFKSVTQPDKASIKTGNSTANTGTMLESTLVYDGSMLENAGDPDVGRVLRGGSYKLYGRYGRSAFRYGSLAESDLIDLHFSDGGIRFALGH